MWFVEFRKVGEANWKRLPTGFRMPVSAENMQVLNGLRGYVFTQVEEDWESARQKITMKAIEVMCGGAPRALVNALRSLVARVQGGERTRELLDAIQRL